MNELKAIQVLINGQPFDLYFKSDTDKVIAEKDKVIAYARALVREDIKLIARQKYKRCLAMAEWCDSKVYHIRRTALCDMSEHEYWQYEDEFWQRWHARWLKIAEQFKETK